MTVTPALRFGLFGTGHWAAQTHAAALSAAPEARLVGVWGRDPAKTAAVAARYGIAAYDDADALLDDVDAVSIALPPEVQVPLAVRAARAGRHLLLEKPIALSATSADELAAAVTSSGVASVVFFTNRFVPAVEQVLRDAIAAGGWHGARGTVLSSIFGDGSPYAGSGWRRASGGLWDLGPHVLSLVLPVLGPATDVTAVEGPYQTAHVLVRHSGGAVSAMTLSVDVPQASSEVDIAILGDRGVTHLPVASVEPVPALARAVAELARAAAGRSGGHACDVRFGWEVNAVLSAAAESAVTGRTVRVQSSPSTPASASTAPSSARDVIPSLGNIRYRWYPTVRWDTSRRSPISRLDSPSSTIRAICCSCAVSCPNRPLRETSARWRSPEARSSASARSRQARAPIASRMSRAVRRCSRDRASWR